MRGREGGREGGRGGRGGREGEEGGREGKKEGGMEREREGGREGVNSLYGDHSLEISSSWLTLRLYISSDYSQDDS